MRTKILTLAGLLGAASSLALAHEGDLGLLWNGTSIVTAVANDATGTFEELGAFVFAGELADLGGGFVGGDEPGFFTTDDASNPVGAFDVGTVLGYQTLAALRVWNGSDFSQIAGPLLSQDRGGDTILTPMTDMTVDGFQWTYAGGESDQHVDFGLVNPEVGVYLWEIRVGATSPNGALLDTTRSLYVVFNYGEDEMVHDQAIDWAENNLPTPGTLPALLGALGIIARRQRG
ncbi:MAG: hypothetical protein R3B57_02835 [Phycisphaerales bacterium]